MFLCQILIFIISGLFETAYQLDHNIKVTGDNKHEKE